MFIELNGDRVEAVEGTTVAALLQQFGIDPARVAVELNVNIVPKANYEKQILCGGDKIEIVQFVGGG